jgi:hypothetical protein
MGVLPPSAVESLWRRLSGGGPAIAVGNSVAADSGATRREPEIAVRTRRPPDSDGGSGRTSPIERPRISDRPANSHHLDGGVLSPAEARALVGDALLALPEETVALAQLLTSELVTNAVMHACTAVDLEIELADFSTRITVQDSSAIEPERRPPSVDLANGRGLALVDGLSSAWGWEHIPTGKRVWFELPASNA